MLLIKLELLHVYVHHTSQQAYKISQSQPHQRSSQSIPRPIAIVEFCHAALPKIYSCTTQLLTCSSVSQPAWPQGVFREAHWIPEKAAGLSADNNFFVNVESRQCSGNVESEHNSQCTEAVQHFSSRAIKSLTGRCLGRLCQFTFRKYFICIKQWHRRTR